VYSRWTRGRARPRRWPPLLPFVGIHEQTIPRACERVLRLAQARSEDEAALCDRDKGRLSICIRRSMGSVARSVTKKPLNVQRDQHRPERIDRAAAQSNARDSSGQRIMTAGSFQETRNVPRGLVEARDPRRNIPNTANSDGAGTTVSIPRAAARRVPIDRHRCREVPMKIAVHGSRGGGA
jgi:hypothetical protein